MKMENKIELLNCDCMEYMKGVPDKFFDLAIVDPPYGIGAGSEKFINGTSKTLKPYYKEKDWDVKPEVQ
jgi:site-specific DNA-methyltransferase (adenine-specific)